MNIFEEYKQENAAKTQISQLRDLTLFAAFFANKGIGVQTTAESLFNEPSAWESITFHLVTEFIESQRMQFAPKTANRRLSTIKKYASLAASVEGIDQHENELIQKIAGVTISKSPAIAQEEKGILPDTVIFTLKSVDNFQDSAVGKRDRLIILLLLDQGLRTEEIAQLRLEDLHEDRSHIYVDHASTKTRDEIKLTADAIEALAEYIAIRMGVDGDDRSLIRSGNTRSGQLQESGISASAVTKITAKYGRQVATKLGLSDFMLSPGNCRKHWAKTAYRTSGNLSAIQEQGGWRNPISLLQYLGEI